MRRFARGSALTCLFMLGLLPACAKLLGADFDVERGSAGGRGGDSAQTGGTAGDTGAGASAGAGAVDGGGTAGTSSGEGGSGEGGAGGAGPEPVDDADGVVLVSVAGEQGCAGLALTNRFVLAPASCVAGAGSPSDVTIALASNAAVAHAVDDVQSSADRDLALLHLDEAFSLGGRTSGFFRAYYPQASSELDGKSLTCIGAKASGELVVDNVEEGVADFGDRVTLSGDAGLLAALELGAGCYAEIGGVSFLAGLKLGDDTALSFGDGAARAFLTKNLLGTRTLETQRQSGVHSVVALPSGQVKVTWLVPVSPFALVHATFDDAGSRLSETVIEPPPGHEEDVDYEVPASAITSDGTLHIVITVPSTNKHWYFARESGAANGTWSELAAPNNVNTGSSLVNTDDGNLHLLSRWHSEVHYAYFDQQEGWTSTWESTFDDLAGDPSGVGWGEGRISVFGRLDGVVRHAARIESEWQSWESLGAAISGTGETRSVAATSLRPGRIDVFSHAPSENPASSELLHRFYDGGVWLSDWVPTGVPVSLYASLAGTSGVGRAYVTFNDSSEDFGLVEYPRE